MSSMQDLARSNFEFDDESSPLKSEEVKCCQELEEAKSGPLFEIEID